MQHKNVHTVEKRQYMGKLRMYEVCPIQYYSQKSIFYGSLLALSVNITYSSLSDMQKVRVLQNFTCRLLMACITEQLSTATHSRINEESLY